MKLTNTQTMKRKSGMTLLELTVVILVLLSLISILFIGARAWKRGSDRAGCILNQRNYQQAVRSYANMNNLNPTDSLASGNIGLTAGTSVIVGPGLFMETEPKCPGSGTYSVAADTTIPDISTVALVCSKAGGTDLHIPQDATGW
jgi:prepilin-type N-terminal cleavage/methylation domain-containing protein